VEQQQGLASVTGDGGEQGRNGVPGLFKNSQKCAITIWKAMYAYNFCYSIKV